MGEDDARKKVSALFFVCMDQYSTNVSMYETLFVDNHVGADDVRQERRGRWAVE